MNFLLWPVWWYSTGLLAVFRALIGHLKAKELSIGLINWLVNMFKPMYGQSDWQGQIISFFMRLVILSYKAVTMIIWVSADFIFLMIWMLMPPAVLYQVLFQFGFI